MSCYHISYDENRNKLVRAINNREEYLAIRNSSSNQVKRQMAFEGKAYAKNGMEQFNYSGHYPSGYLAGSNLPSAAFGFDVDDVETFERIAHLLLDGLPDEPEEQKTGGLPTFQDHTLTPLGKELGVLMVERSASQGGHIVFKREMGRTILENQIRVARTLNCEMDTSTHDNNRVYFTTTASGHDLLFLDNRLFEDEYDEAAVAEEARVLEERELNKWEELPEGAHQKNKHFMPWAAEESTMVVNKVQTAVASSETATETSVEEETSKEEQTTASKAELTYQGIPYSRIIQKYWELYHHGKEPSEGNRNSLTYEIAQNIASICEYDMNQLKQIIPCYDGLPEQERDKAIGNALKQPHRGMTYRLRTTLEAVRKDRRMEAMGGTASAPPPLPKKLPAVIKHLTSNVPDYYKPAVAVQCMPALAALLHGVMFLYCDNTPHGTGLMGVNIGQQGIGKSCVNKPIDFILKRVKARDAENRKREAEWKRQNPANKSKAKDPRPTDILVRCLSNNLTEALFNQRLIDANQNGECTLYLSVNELDGLLKITNGKNMKEVGLVIRNAYDWADGGQERVGSDGVSGIAPTRFNFNAATTPANARLLMKNWVSNGTLSRLTFSTIQRDEDDDSMPIFGAYDQAYEDKLQPFLDKLDAANGLICCKQANNLALRLKKKCDEFAAGMESNAYRVLSHRSIVSAWRVAMTIFVAQGQKWTRDIAEFMEWFVQYDLYCKMLYFGEDLEQELSEEKKIQQQSGPKNMLTCLEGEFTKQDYIDMRIRMGKPGDGDATLRSWASRGYIVWDPVAQVYINKRCEG